MKQFHPSAERVNELVGSAFEKGCYYLVSRQENKLAGLILIGPSTDFFSKEEIGFIYELYVVPEYRGQGLAKPLLQKAIDELLSKDTLKSDSAFMLGILRSMCIVNLDL